MKIFKLLLLLLTQPALAQFTVAPFGSSISAIPVGQSINNQCLENCEFEIILRPFCFGTNLRAYPAAIQMDPNESITANIIFKNPKDKKEDKFNISFPGKITFATEGSLIDCDIITPMLRPGIPRDISCPVPGIKDPIRYTLKDWQSKINPHADNEFIRYSGIGLPATLNNPSVVGIDKNITCLYKFTNMTKKGKLINSSVACYFPSSLPDLSSQITIMKDGNELKGADNVEISAYTNFIKIKIKKLLNSVPNKLVVKNGVMVLPKPAEHSIEFTQTTNGKQRKIFDSYEKKGFDESNGFQSFTTQVKFAGSQGFCGGYYSPLMLFFDEKLPKFNGVSSFPLYGLAQYTPVHWPEPKAPGYFLVHLKNRKTPVTSHTQLFGQDDKFDNGFEALKVHDENMDGQIDKKDKIFNSLYLWSDSNGNGHSEMSEIRPLSDKKVVRVSLNYTTNDPSNFQNRARVREKGSFEFLKAGKVTKARIYDVWLSPLEQ